MLRSSPKAHGFDGFTMQELAEAADVSRRTLFNYYPSKTDAVLGVPPTLSETSLEQFRSRGAGSSLLQDLSDLGNDLLDAQELNREDLTRARGILLENPRLLAAAHDRFLGLSAQIVEEIRDREGGAFDAHRAQVAVRLLGAMFDAALDSFLADPDERPLADAYRRRAPCSPSAAGLTLTPYRAHRGVTTSQEKPMATLLYRLGKTAYRRWPLFIAAWLVAMIGVVSVAGAFSKPMSDAFSIPGIPSERAADLQSELFAGAADAFDQASVKVVVAAPEGELLSEPANKADVDALVADLSALPQMPDGSDQTKPVPANPVDAAADLRTQLTESADKSGSDLAKAEADASAISPLSEDGRVGTITWDFDVETVADVKPGTIESLEDTMAEPVTTASRSRPTDPGPQAMPEIGGKSELIGIAVAVLVLHPHLRIACRSWAARAHGALRRRPRASPASPR